MDTKAHLVRRAAASCHCLLRSPYHAPTPTRKQNRGPRRSWTVHISHAVAVQGVQLHQPIDAGLTRSQVVPGVGTVAAGPVRHNVVEVHLQVKYKCSFGQHLAVVGSAQGWQTSSAVPMRWSEGDVWTVVLTLPYGCDIEYKYIVAAEGGAVVRWQEGTNNKLSLINPGYLLHVADTWAQDSRQVHEFGLPAAATRAAADAKMRAAGSCKGRSDSSSGSGSSKPAAAQNVLLQNNITCFSLNSSIGGQPSAVKEAAGMEAVSGNVRPAASADSSSSSKGSSSTRSPDLSGQVADVKESPFYQIFSTNVQQQQQQQQAAHQLQQAEMAAADASGAAAVSAAAVAAAPAASAAISDTISSHQQQQLQMQPLGGELSQEMTELLPLLQRELQSALAALASYPGTETDRDELLSEGQVVLQALQQQLQHGPALPASAQVLQQQHDQPAAAAAGRSSIKQQREGKQRAPSDSTTAVSMATASEDEIAAALLSDDCEEACFCLVDAICSCMCSADGADADECCIDNEGHHSHINHSNSQVNGTATAATAVGQPAASIDASAMEPEVVTAAELAALQLQQQQQLLHMSHAASAAAHAAVAVQGFESDKGSAEARAAAFAGVQRALQQSADLLEHLSDPCHPLMLKADREVADAKTQLGHLLAA